MENQQVYPSINQSPKPQRPQSQPTMAPQGQPVGQNVVYMPVYTQNVQQQPQVFPAQQQVPQPVPVAPVASIEELKSKVQRVSKRVKCSSLSLIAFGVIGMCFSAHKIYGARHAAFRIIQGKRPFGPPDDDFAPPEWGDEESMKAFEQKQADFGSQIMTRDELAAYDIIKSGAFFLFLLSMLTILLGKCGMWAQWRQKVKCSYRVSKKSMIIIGVICVLGHLVKNEARDLHHIVRRYKHKNNASSFVASDNQTETLNLTAARELREENYDFVDRQQDEAQFGKYLDMMQHKHGFKEGDDDEKCSKYDSDACESDDTCSWCESAAVPSACHSIEAARSLPDAVFKCDKLSEEEQDSFKNDGPWGYSGKQNGHHKHHDHPRHDEKPPCMGQRIMKLARAIYVALIGFHMFNHYSLYKSIKTLDTKRVENGEVLSDDQGCHWGGKKEWKNKRGNRNVNNTGSSSETASQMH